MPRFAHVPARALSAALGLMLSATAAVASTAADTPPADASVRITSAEVPTAAAAPQTLVRQLSAQVIATIQADASLRGGDVAKIAQLVDAQVMPHVNFRRMTSAAVGPKWREATPEQRDAIQAEFKALLIRTYAGALAQVTPEQSLQIAPVRAQPEDNDVLVRTQVVGGRGEPLPIEFRLERKAAGEPWKIYNFNVLGVWLVENYRTQFATELNAGGVDGLIAALKKLNQK